MARPRFFSLQSQIQLAIAAWQVDPTLRRDFLGTGKYQRTFSYSWKNGFSSGPPLIATIRRTGLSTTVGVGVLVPGLLQCDPPLFR